MTAPATDTESAAAPPASKRWRDRRKYLWLFSLIVPLLPLRAAALADASGPVFWWLGPIAILVAVPLLDFVFGLDKSNPPESEVPRLEADLWYRAVLYSFVPLQFFGLFYGAHIVNTRDLSAIDMIGFSLTVGVVAGVGINAAHELGHKRPRHERWLSRLSLTQSAYGHFYVEHNRGHHLRVSTPEDPASARLGESFWAFLPRTVIGSMRSAWQIESKRLVAQGHRVWGLRNEIVLGWLMSAVLFVVIVVVFGPIVIPFLVIQAIVGFCLLEVVNYIEHYGLARQRTAAGRYERCRPEHSWNANHRASNLVLYQLERHSDHHAHPTRRYQALRHFDDAPQLPSGYAGMLVLACIPPLWRRVMDHRVAEHYGGDLTLANVHPPKRERYLGAGAI